MERKSGSFLLNVVVLLAVLGATGLTATLLARTMRATDRINLKAKNIARTGQGINTATDSVIQLSRTNELAGSILASTQPLGGDLNAMVEQAKALDTLSGSIDASTGAINATVAELLATANGMSDTANGLNGTTKKIPRYTSAGRIIKYGAILLRCLLLVAAPAIDQPPVTAA